MKEKYSVPQALEKLFCVDNFSNGKRVYPRAVVESSYGGSDAGYFVTNAIKTTVERKTHYPKYLIIESKRSAVSETKNRWDMIPWMHVLEGLSVDKDQAYQQVLDYSEVFSGDCPPAETNEFLKDIQNHTYQGMLNTYKKMYLEKYPLFTLGSNPMIGWLEFYTICKIMGKRRRFSVLIWDTNKAGHYMAAQFIKDDPSWRVNAEQDGHILATRHLQRRKAWRE